jgi:2-methylisocitrate lyase-like PEP mutase family enzyme
MPTIADRRRTFRTLHERGCFVVPNPWDVGSARYLQSLGLQASDSALALETRASRGFPLRGRGVASVSVMTDRGR